MLGLALPLIAVGVKALSIPPTNGPTQSILIISEPPSSSFDPCLRSAYYGAYGGSSTDREYIFLPSDDCLVGPATSALSSGDIQSGSITYIDPAFHGPSGGRLVWVGQAGVAPDMAENESGNILQSWAGIQHKAAETTLIKVRRDEEWNTGEHEYQSHYSTGPTPRMITMVHASAKSLLLAVPEEYLPILDTLLPRHLVPVALPLQPYAGTSQAEGGAWEPVPDYLAKNLANITKNLKFDPKLDMIMNDGLEVDQLRRDIRWLTGEGPSGIESRHSFTEGALKAAKYIKGIAEESGAKCDLHHFLPHFAPNVLCSYPSITNSTELVILSAHYDSRGSFGLTRAPGGDDDGSGSGHLLQIARAIGKLGIRFEKKVAFAWHAGEEQGLYGSHYVAEKLKKENATVLLQVQADMLGYHVPGEPLQLGLPESIETPEASALLHAISQLYSPELVLGKTAACCSDHQSFLSYGFPATAVFERNGPIADPMYHNTGDVSQREGYDLEQILSIAKVTMGAVLTVAGWKRE